MVRKLSKSDPPICKIDVTGFAGVMLALLATFMAPCMLWHDLPMNAVDLPKANNSVVMRGAKREDALIIYLSRDGRVHLGDDRVTIELLPELIRKGLANGAERKVYLEVDHYAKYGIVLSTLAEVRSAGIEKIGFVTNRYSPHPTSGP
jgi:biopolymer transport protein ExbD